MKLLMKTEFNTPKKETKPEVKEISSVFPNGKFMEHSSNPYKYWGDSTKKSYYDKYCNSKQTIKENISIKVKYLFKNII